MRHLAFATEQAARDRSNQEALRRGCQGVTAFWWGWSPSGSGWVLEIAPGDEGGLTPDEVARLTIAQAAE